MLVTVRWSVGNGPSWCGRTLLSSLLPLRTRLDCKGERLAPRLLNRHLSIRKKLESVRLSVMNAVVNSQSRRGKTKNFRSLLAENQNTSNGYIFAAESFL